MSLHNYTIPLSQQSSYRSSTSLQEKNVSKLITALVFNTFSVLNIEFASRNSSKKTNTVSILKDTEPWVQTQGSPNYQHIILRLQKLQSFIPTNNAQTPHNPQNLRNFNTIFEWDRINWRNFKTHVTHRCEEGVAWTLSIININGCQNT